MEEFEPFSEHWSSTLYNSQRQFQEMKVWNRSIHLRVASLDEKFTASKTQIEGYKLELKDATSREEKSHPRGLPPIIKPSQTNQFPCIELSALYARELIDLRGLYQASQTGNLLCCSHHLDIFWWFYRGANFYFLSLSNINSREGTTDRCYSTTDSFSGTTDRTCDNPSRWLMVALHS